MSKGVQFPGRGVPDKINRGGKFTVDRDSSKISTLVPEEHQIRMRSDERENRKNLCMVNKIHMSKDLTTHASCSLQLVNGSFCTFNLSLNCLNCIFLINQHSTSDFAPNAWTRGNSFDFPRVFIFPKAHHLTSKGIKNNNNQQQFQRDQKLGVFL